MHRAAVVLSLTAILSSGLVGAGPPIAAALPDSRDQASPVSASLLALYDVTAQDPSVQAADKALRDLLTDPAVADWVQEAGAVQSSEESPLLGVHMPAGQASSPDQIAQIYLQSVTHTLTSTKVGLPLTGNSDVDKSIEAFNEFLGSTQGAIAANVLSTFLASAEVHDYVADRVALLLNEGFSVDDLVMDGRAVIRALPLVVTLGLGGTIGAIAAIAGGVLTVACAVTVCAPVAGVVIGTLAVIAAAGAMADSLAASNVPAGTCVAQANIYYDAATRYMLTTGRIKCGSAQSYISMDVWLYRNGSPESGVYTSCAQTKSCYAEADTSFATLGTCWFGHVAGRVSNATPSNPQDYTGSVCATR